MKLSITHSRILIVLFVLTLFSFNNGFAQCKSVVQDGINKLEPFVFNGQINTIDVKKGKPAKVHLAFYKGRTYKIQITTEPVFVEKISFKIFDEKKNEIFDSSAKNADSFTFYSNSAQELIVEVYATEVPKHCVAVLVGTEAPKNSGSMRYL
jgi:hypothetical protein